MLKKIILCLLMGIITSLFYFPVIFTFLPAFNTKNLLGAVGAVLILYALIKQRELYVDKGILTVFIISALVSIIAFASTVINNTADMAYATFIVSTAIWLSGAFAVCSLMKSIHGHISLELVVNYLAAVCVFQCVIALMIDSMPSVQMFVDRWVEQGQAFMQKTNRLYGIGASLDTAGGRFAICIILLFGVLRNDTSKNWSLSQWFYLISIAIILIVGNMIARTTITGVVLGFVFFIMTSDFWKMSFGKQEGSMLRKIVLVLLVFIPLSVFLYRTSPLFHEWFRFGFEGFFSLVETGEWNVRSNTALESMVVYPDNFKTWVIGDGYFGSPNGDLNYLGDLSIGGYYMGTDIGFLRFIFYFGLIGLSAMVAYVWYSSKFCSKMYKDYKIVFFFIFLVGLVIWMKVATDVFLAFALFICAGLLGKEQRTVSKEEDEKSIATE